jgi:hypothetical protein
MIAMTLQLQPASDPYDAAVDDAIATCDGDLRGAVKALLIANEFLERDLQKASMLVAASNLRVSLISIPRWRQNASSQVGGTTRQIDNRTQWELRKSHFPITD